MLERRDLALGAGDGFFISDGTLLSVVQGEAQENSGG
jgi:hypothetical protein